MDWFRTIRLGTEGFAVGRTTYSVPVMPMGIQILLPSYSMRQSLTSPGIVSVSTTFGTPPGAGILTFRRVEFAISTHIYVPSKTSPSTLPPGTNADPPPLDTWYMKILVPPELASQTLFPSKARAPPPPDNPSRVGGKQEIGTAGGICWIKAVEAPQIVGDPHLAGKHSEPVGRAGGKTQGV